MSTRQQPSVVQSQPGRITAPDGIWRRRGWTIGLGLAGVGAIIGISEIVERLWLGDGDVDARQVLHLVRGIASTVLAAVLVGWLIVRASPPLLARSPTHVGESARATPPMEQERLDNFARWLVLMRWIAVIVALTLSFITVKLARLLTDTAWVPLVVTVAVLACINTLYAVQMRWGRPRPWLLIVQVYVDLVILTMLLHFSGGIENPLSLVLLLHVIIGGIVFSRGHCYAVAAAASIMYTLLAVGELTHVLHHETLLLFPHGQSAEHSPHASHAPLFVFTDIGFQTALLFLTAYFVTTLADRLRHDERQLASLAQLAQAEQQLLERSLETTGTALRIVDHDLNPAWQNRQWSAWFGRGGSEAVTESLDREDSPARQTLADGRIRVTELVEPPAGAGVARFDSGAVPRTFQLTTAPLLDGDGRVNQVVELIQDVTGQKGMQAQMLRAGQLAALGELAGQVAHEVNNPIAIISAKARLLVSDHGDELPEETVEELGKIIDLSDRVAGIAGGLLSYSRPSGVARDLVDLRHTIRSAAAMIGQRAGEVGVEIEDALPDELPKVRASAQDMERLFLNLMLNSLDAMPSGGRLTLSARTEDGQVGDAHRDIAIVVEDTGCGIDPAVCDRIFEPFFTTKERYHGTGLGLSICEGLVRSHGGRIDVESRPGRGARFIVRLPVEEDESR